MAQAKGINAYPAARSLLDRALEAERGIKIHCGSFAEAFKMRMNCYTVRSRQRSENRKIYPESSPMHNSTPWDGIEMWIEDSAGRRITQKPEEKHEPHTLIFQHSQIIEVEEL